MSNNRPIAKLYSALNEDKRALMAFRAACRRLQVDADMALRAIRVAAGMETMPFATAIAPWEEEPPAETK